jgi:putative membrane protein
MQIVRTIVWVLLLVALLIFAVNNWNPVEVKIWEGLVLETKIPALVIVSFLIGLVPMWLFHRGKRFYWSRRIASLETAARTAAVTPVAPPPPAPEPAPAAVAGPTETPAEDSGPLKSE